MNLLRSLQFCQTRAMHMVANFLPQNTSQGLIAASAFSRLTRTGQSLTVYAHSVRPTSCCFPCLNYVCRCFHVTTACWSLDQNANNNILSEKSQTFESLKLAEKMDNNAATSDSLLANDQLSVTKDVLQLDIDSEKPESRIHLDESKRELVVYIDNRFTKVKAVDLYKVIRKMDTAQVLSLVEHSHQLLDKTHLALCLKRLFTLTTKYPQHCDVDVIRHDQRFQILCAYVAKKARYLQPAILNDVVTFLCHFGTTSSQPVMRVCLQLMMKQINNLALDQLTVLAHDLSGLDATKQTRVLQNAIGVLCNTRGDQLSLLSIEHKIYLLEEYGSKLQYTDQLLDSLWGDRREMRKWQEAVGFFVALAKAAAPTGDSDSKTMLQRHQCLAEWCIDIVLQQYVWLNVADIEALLAAFVQLDIYDADLFRILGNRAVQQCSDVQSQLSVWNLLADADYMHVGLMDAVLTDLRNCDVQQLTVETQLSLLPFIAEAVNYYCSRTTDGEQLSSYCFSDTISACVEQLGKTLQMSEHVPEDLQLDTCLYWTVLQKLPPDLLSSHVLDTCVTQLSTAQLAYGHSQASPTQLDKLILLAHLQNSSNPAHTRVPELVSLVYKQSRPRSVLRPVLLMACGSVTDGHTTSLGFYADHVLPSKTTDKQSMVVLCWYDSDHFWINTGRLKCIPHLYATTLQRLHSYDVLVVNASAWLSLKERERFMYISAAVTKELHGLTVI